MIHQIARGVAVVVVAALLSVPTGATEVRSINLNTATAAELSALKGIGDAKAQAIVAHREKNGNFKSVDDLKAVAGIGDKLLEQLRPQVTISSDAKSEPARKQ
jgi:competence protein ComEA